MKRIEAAGFKSRFKLIKIYLNDNIFKKDSGCFHICQFKRVPVKSEVQPFLMLSLK
jgi:hypothetical protein